jgi:hypothetical protein
MNITLIARFYNSALPSRTPLALSTPRQVNYVVTAYDNIDVIATINGSVTAPAGVTTYTFNVPLPAGTEFAEGVLLAGDFLTFSCGGNS